MQGCIVTYTRLCEPTPDVDLYLKLANKQLERGTVMDWLQKAIKGANIWVPKPHLAGEDMLGRGIGGVQEEHVNALIEQRRVAPHARMPSHVPRVQNNLHGE